MADVYKTIDILLKEGGISGAKMCSDLGMSRSFMTELRKGRAKSFKAATARKIANYFGVGTDYLLGIGPKHDPVFPSRKIFSVMNEQKLTLNVLSERIGIAVETIRAFACGEKVEDGRDCLEKIAEVLDVGEDYLMGWTGYKESSFIYSNISEEAWRHAKQDPQEAHDLQEYLDTEETFLNMEREEQQLNEKTPTLTPKDERDDSMETKLVELYRELNEEGQEKLVDYAEDLVAGGRYIKSDQVIMDKEA